MRFKFPYEQLMNYRKSLEELAMRDFISARAAHDEAVNELQQMHQSIEDTRKMIARTVAEGGQEAERLRQMDEFIHGQLIRIDHQNQAVKERLNDLNEKQAILQQRAQEFKILEQLRDRLLERHKQTEKKRELKQMDDLVVMRFKPGDE